MGFAVKFFGSLALLVAASAVANAEQPIMTVTEMIEYWGYPVEEHFVTTEDGYNLLMHRIPGGQNGIADDGRPPVFIGHCLLCTSAIFAFGPPEKDLAYMLADEGYDVWMGNTRGNTWSRDNDNLDPDNDVDFWDFDWGTSGAGDYPVEIDYVLENTGASDVLFTGFSMGTTQYFVLLSEKPEYNDKIRAGFLMAPPVYMGNVCNNVFNAFKDTTKELEDFVHNDLGFYEILPHSDFFSTLGHDFCDDDHPDLQAICVDVFGLFLPTEILDPSMISFYLDHLPGGATIEMFTHYIQNSNSPGKFMYYDYGTPEENQDRYGQDTPPEYDISKVTAPTALYVGDGDCLATVADTDELAADLPNLISYEVVDYPGFTHMAFAWANNADELVFSKIVDGMNSYI